MKENLILNFQQSHEGKNQFTLQAGFLLRLYFFRLVLLYVREVRKSILMSQVLDRGMWKFNLKTFW